MAIEDQGLHQRMTDSHTALAAELGEDFVVDRVPWSIHRDGLKIACKLCHESCCDEGVVSWAQSHECPPKSLKVWRVEYQMPNYFYTAQTARAESYDEAVEKVRRSSPGCRFYV